MIDETKVGELEQEAGKVYFSSIAGINFHATEDDLGPVFGSVKKTPVESDPEAYAVIKNNGALLGYIPKKDKESYKEFIEDPDAELCFSGNIKRAGRIGAKKFFVGNIAVIKSDNPMDLLVKYRDTDFNLYGGKEVKD